MTPELVEDRIYTLPNGDEVTPYPGQGEEPGGYILYNRADYEDGMADYEIQPDGWVTFQGNPTGWTITDLTDTGQQAGEEWSNARQEDDAE